MTHVRYVSPQIESVILKLNALGQHYLDLVKNMTFIEKLFGLRNNGDRAIKLSELNVDKLDRPGINVFYCDSLDKIDACKKTSKGKWLNEHLRDDFIMKAKFLDYMSGLVWHANPGRDLVPGILKILTDAGFKYNVSDVKTDASPIHAMRLNLLRETDEYLTQEAMRQNAFSEGYNAAMNTHKSIQNNKTTSSVETQTIQLSLRR